jgi:hypothetical protein
LDAETLALTFVTYLWGDKYPEDYARKLAAAVKRHAPGARFMVFTDRERNLDCQQAPIPREDFGLLKIPGCFARLRLFDWEYQAWLGWSRADRIVNLDLDIVVTGDLSWLASFEDDFYILQDINTSNVCPFNGSMWAFRTGYRPDIWSDFSLDAYTRLGVPMHAIPDDQGWFSYKVPDAGKFGPHCGVYGFKKRGWPSGDALPANACIVAFPGWRDPSKFEHLSWVRDNWRV